MIAHQRPYSLWLEDIRDAAERIVTYTEGLDLEAFVASESVRDAVLLRFLVMGEAARNLAIYFPGDDRHASLPLASMRMMRNRLIHGYWDVDSPILWQAARQDVPPVLARVGPLIAAEAGR